MRGSYLAVPHQPSPLDPEWSVCLSAVPAPPDMPQRYRPAGTGQAVSGSWTGNKPSAPRRRAARPDSLGRLTGLHGNTLRGRDKQSLTADGRLTLRRLRLCL